MSHPDVRLSPVPKGPTAQPQGGLLRVMTLGLGQGTLQQDEDLDTFWLVRTPGRCCSLPLAHAADTGQGRWRPRGSDGRPGSSEPSRAFLLVHFFTVPEPPASGVRFRALAADRASPQGSSGRSPDLGEEGVKYTAQSGWLKPRGR